MTIDQIIEHVVISSLGWLIGVSAGVAFGYAIAVFSLRVYPPRTPSQLWGTLFPWRTIVAGLFLLNLFPYIPIRIFGLGQDTSIFSTAFAIMLCAAVLTVQTVRFTPTPMILRSISGLRSLAVLSVVVVTHYGFYGGAGLGQVIQRGILRVEEPLSLVAGGWIIGIALTFDLVIGLLQFLLGSKILAGESRYQVETG